MSREAKYIFFVSVLIFLISLLCTRYYIRDSKIENFKKNYLFSRDLRFGFHKDCTCGIAHPIPPDNKSTNYYINYDVIPTGDIKFSEISEKFLGAVLYNGKEIGEREFEVYTDIKKALTLPKFVNQKEDEYPIKIRPTNLLKRISKSNTDYYCVNYTIINERISFKDYFTEELIILPIDDIVKIKNIKINLTKNSILKMEDSVEKLFNTIKACPSHYDNFHKRSIIEFNYEN